MQPKVFAPGIISTDNDYEFGSVFSPKGHEFYFAVRLNDEWKAEIRHTQLEKGEWTKSEGISLVTLYGHRDL